MEQSGKISGFNSSLLNTTNNETQVENTKILDEFTNFLSQQEKNYEQLNDKTKFNSFYDEAKKFITLVKQEDEALSLFKNYPKVFTLFNIQEQSEIKEIIAILLKAVEDSDNDDLRDEFIKKFDYWKEHAHKSEILSLANEILSIERPDTDFLITQLKDKWDELNVKSGETVSLERAIQDQKFNKEIDNEMLTQYKSIFIDKKNEGSFDAEMNELLDSINKKLKEDVNFGEKLRKDIDVMKEIYKKENEIVEPLNSFQEYLNTQMSNLEPSKKSNEVVDNISVQEKELFTEKDVKSLDQEFKKTDSEILIKFKTILDNLGEEVSNNQEEGEKFLSEAHSFVESDLEGANQLLFDLESLKEVYKNNDQKQDAINFLQNSIKSKMKRVIEARESDETYLIATKKLKEYKLKLGGIETKIEGAYVYKSDEVDITKVVPLGKHIASGEMGSVSWHARSEWVVKEGENLLREYFISTLLGIHPAFVKLHRLYLKNVEVKKGKEEHTLVMDFVPGKTLTSIINTESYVNMKVAADLFQQLPGNIQYLFDKNVVCRDVNTGNIILTKENKLVFIDYGFWSEVKDDRKKGEDLLKGVLQIMDEILMCTDINRQERAKLIHPKEFFSEDFDYEEYVNSFTAFNIGFGDCSRAVNDIIEKNSEQIEKDPMKFLNSYMNAVINNVKKASESTL